MYESIKKLVTSKVFNNSIIFFIDAPQESLWRNDFWNVKRRKVI